MNTKYRTPFTRLPLVGSMTLALLTGTITLNNRCIAEEKIRETESSEIDISLNTQTMNSEPISNEAVTIAIQEYVRAKYAGNDETVRSRAHHAIARRTVVNSYWGQPSQEWVRPYFHDNLRFYGTSLNETKREDPENGRCEIEVFDIENRTASARVIMEDVVDFLHMIYFNGRWVIADSAVFILDSAGTRPPAISTDKKGKVEQVVRDYCTGFYDINGDKVQNTCHPILSKRCVEHANRGDADFDFLSAITFEEIKILGETFNKVHGFDPETSRCQIEIYEIRENIAAVKLTGSIWFDYIHLLRINNEWKIVNIMYETLDQERWTDVKNSDE